MMMPITFTQFILPNGRTEQVSIQRPVDVEKMASEIKLHGYAFEVEILTTGLVSMEILNRMEEDVLAHELCENGPVVLEAVDLLVRNAYENLKKRGVIR